MSFNTNESQQSNPSEIHPIGSVVDAVLLPFPLAFMSSILSPFKSEKGNMSSGLLIALAGSGTQSSGGPICQYIRRQMGLPLGPGQLTSLCALCLNTLNHSSHPLTLLSLPVDDSMWRVMWWPHHLGLRLMDHLCPIAWQASPLFHILDASRPSSLQCVQWWRASDPFFLLWTANLIQI